MTFNGFARRRDKTRNRVKDTWVLSIKRCAFAFVCSLVRLCRTQLHAWKYAMTKNTATITTMTTTATNGLVATIRRNKAMDFIWRRFPNRLRLPISFSHSLKSYGHSNNIRKLNMRATEYSKKNKQIHTTMRIGVCAWEGVKNEQTGDWRVDLNMEFPTAQQASDRRLCRCAHVWVRARISREMCALTLRSAH